MNKIINRTNVIIVNLIMLAGVVLVFTVFKGFSLNALFIFLDPNEVQAVAVVAWVMLALANFAYELIARLYLEKQKFDYIDWLITGSSLLIVITCVLFLIVPKGQI